MQVQILPRSGSEDANGAPTVHKACAGAFTGTVSCNLLRCLVKAVPVPFLSHFPGERTDSRCSIVSPKGLQ